MQREGTSWARHMEERTREHNAKEDANMDKATEDVMGAHIMGSKEDPMGGHIMGRVEKGGGGACYGNTRYSVAAFCRKDVVPIMEDPMEERQGKGFASQRPSNMEPLSDEGIFLAKINEENEEELQVLIKSAPLHAKIMMPGWSEEDCVFTLD
ncbi:hypothetical protein L7F22_024238 [Adiantum nelumboides]|nr:hypothetical protein [Adiantum nelumboides]